MTMKEHRQLVVVGWAGGKGLKKVCQKARRYLIFTKLAKNMELICIIIIIIKFLDMFYVSLPLVLRVIFLLGLLKHFGPDFSCALYST